MTREINNKKHDDGDTVVGMALMEWRGSWAESKSCLLLETQSVAMLVLIPACAERCG